MHTRFLQYAEDLARSFAWDSKQNFRLCAVVVLNGKPVGVGFNKPNIKSKMQHPYEHYRTKQKPSRKMTIGLHAEVDAILDARRRKCHDLSGAKIYVVRLALTKDKFGHVETTMARPCAMCQAILANTKIKKVYYTISPSEQGIIAF